MTFHPGAKVRAKNLQQNGELSGREGRVQGVSGESLIVQFLPEEYPYILKADEVEAL